MAGKRILIVHGSADRIASPQRSAGLARALSRQTEVAYITISGGKHAMLGRHASFDGLAAEFAVLTLCGITIGAPMSRIASGERQFRL